MNEQLNIFRYQFHKSCLLSRSDNIYTVAYG